MREFVEDLRELVDTVAAAEEEKRQQHDAGEEVRRAVAECPMLMVGRHGCCVSHVVKLLLQGLGVNPAVHEVADEAELAGRIDAGDVATLPGGVRRGQAPCRQSLRSWSGLGGPRLARVSRAQGQTREMENIGTSDDNNLCIFSIKLQRQQKRKGGSTLLVLYKDDLQWGICYATTERIRDTYSLAVGFFF